MYYSIDERWGNSNAFFFDIQTAYDIASDLFDLSDSEAIEFCLETKCVNDEWYYVDLNSVSGSFCDNDNGCNSSFHGGSIVWINPAKEITLCEKCYNKTLNVWNIFE